MSVGLLAVLHSLVDFSLQIPGFAIVVFGLLGVGVAQSFSNPEKALLFQMVRKKTFRSD
jgi:hypothetical protein